MWREERLRSNTSGAIVPSPANDILEAECFDEGREVRWICEQRDAFEVVDDLCSEGEGVEEGGEEEDVELPTNERECEEVLPLETSFEDGKECGEENIVWAGCEQYGWTR